MVGKSTMVGIRAAPLAIEWISRSRGMPPTIRHSAQFAKVQLIAAVDLFPPPFLIRTAILRAIKCDSAKSH
jgi:hypothetical protein